MPQNLGSWWSHLLQYLPVDSKSNCLPVEFCEVAYANAFTEAEQIVYRQIVLKSWWKLQKQLQIGKEKKLSSALRYECISSKRRKAHVEEEEEFDLLKTFMVEEDDVKAVADP